MPFSGNVAVKEFMTTTVATLTPEMTVMDATFTMLQNKISCIIIIKSEDDREPIGILTERDLAKIITQEVNARETPITSMMTSPVITLSQDSLIGQVLEQFAGSRIRHMIFTDEHGKLAGIMTQTDVIKAVTLYA